MTGWPTRTWLGKVTPVEVTGDMPSVSDLGRGVGSQVGSCLEKEHGALSRLRDPASDHATGRPGTNHDHVEHGFTLPSGAAPLACWRWLVAPVPALHAPVHEGDLRVARPRGEAAGDNGSIELHDDVVAL